MKKRILTIVLCALLVMALSVPASAVASGSLSASQVQVGDTFTVTVSVSETTVSSMSMVISKSSNLEVVSGQWLISGMIADFDSGNNAGAWAAGVSAAAVSGNVFQATFKAIAAGPASVSIQAQGKNGGTQVFLDTVSKNPTVVCATHSFGSWTTGDGTNHSRSCSACGVTETAAHTWDGGSVVKPASCKEEGAKTYACTTCNAATTESIPKTDDHSYGTWTKADADVHQRVCSVCDKVETVNHSYSTKWSRNKNQHWHECSACKDKKDAAAHTPGSAATETKAQTCTTCGYVIKAALGHTHHYADAWTTDASGHWYVCSGCEEKKDFAAHDFESECDPDCSICGYTREVAHKFAETWETNSEKHWHVCTQCGLMQEESVHTPGPAATEEAAQTCTVCGYELAPMLEPKPTQTETVPTENAPQHTGDEPADGGFPWWIILIVAVIVAGGVIFVIIKKKK